MAQDYRPELLLPVSDQLEIRYLSRLFDNMSECYKLFWFQAILELSAQGQSELVFDDLINEMIASAWYMVSEYRLNLGPRDTLEMLVSYVFEDSGLKSSAKRTEILRFLRECRDPDLQRRKQKLSLNVPYRLQAPFLRNMHTDDWKTAQKLLVQRINQEQRLIYYFLSFNGLQSRIRLDPRWQDYFHANQEILRGWINYHMVEYLQRRNPNVPGIIDKLAPPQERKLTKVIAFWKMVAAVGPVRDIYAQSLITEKDISIDHFVPWSYVANDEFWNLSPTTKSINSSKSNSLPGWELYFPRLCSLEYESRLAVQQYPAIRQQFEKCEREHVNSAEVQRKLYSGELEPSVFAGRLREILLPVYNSAKNMGFKEWIYERQDA